MRILFFLLFGQMNRLMKMLSIFVWSQAASTMLVCTEEEQEEDDCVGKFFWCRSSKERSRIKKERKAKKLEGKISPNILNNIARKCLRRTLLKSKCPTLLKWVEIVEVSSSKTLVYVSDAAGANCSLFRLFRRRRRRRRRRQQWQNCHIKKGNHLLLSFFTQKDEGGGKKKGENCPFFLLLRH